MFKKSLLWQLYPAYLSITVAALFIITLYLSRLLPEFYYDQVVDNLRARAYLIEQQILPDLKAKNVQSLNDVVRKLGKSSSTRITIILPDGRVIAESDENPAEMENHGNRPEFRKAIEKGIGRSLRPSDTLGTSMMYLALPLEEQGQMLAVIRTSIPVTAIEENLKHIYHRIVLSVVIVAICAAGISLVISRKISRPIEQMKETAQRFASGRFDRVPIPKQVELAELAQALNEMARQLRDRINTITRQRNEVEAILSSMAEGVVAVDVNNRIVSINRAAAKFLNIDLTEAKGRTVEDIVHNTEFQAFIQGILNDENSCQTEVVLPGRKDRIVGLNGTTLTDSNGDKSGAVIVISDMTRMRRLEDVRRDFVANVSHELRTPITSIKGFAETLLEGAFKEPEKAERFLQIIAKHADRLNAIVEDLLSLSSLEEGRQTRKITFEKASIRPVLDSVVSMSTIKAEEKDITVELDCAEDIEARINTVLLEQAILNLVDNAIKYSESKSTIRIEAHQSDDMIRIAVRDSGCGIAKKHQNRIFERFYVVDKSRSRKLGGTGLGLAIVKHIAEVHGGHVTLESSPGQGCTFTVHLPAE
ncbi:MAG: HAMP domain-containing protein [Sedimentisphaerales bacterium]|nr:HAMP domain-containing protein [Sedimentisphaerales bacterium]